MSGRDFEKSIQEKANQLRLQPSPEVWEKVELQIRERRRKRGLAWFFLSAAIVAGGLSFWLFAPQGPGHVSTKVQVSATDKTAADNSVTDNSGTYNSADNNSTGNNSATDNSTGNKKPENLVGEKNSGNAILNSGVKAGESQLVINPESATAPTDSETTAGIGKNSQPSSQDKPMITADNKKINKVSQKNKSSRAADITAAENKIIAEGKTIAVDKTIAVAKTLAEPKTVAEANRLWLVADNKQESTPRELFPSMIAPLNLSEPVIAIKGSAAKEGDRKLTDSLLVARQKPTVNKNWRTSVVAGGGISSLQEGVFQSSKMGAGNAFQSTIALPPMNTSAGMQRSPSDVKPGPAFHVGISLNREMRKRTSIGFGIQYAYQSNRIRVGQSIDSAAALLNERLQSFTARNAYAGSGNQGSVYHNTYHYLQIPFEFSWNPGGKKKIYWNTGMTVGYLLGTDALQYNETVGVYYKDKSMVNKWMAAVQTGVYYRFKAPGKWQISAGPFIQYHLNTPDKSANGKNLLYTGLGARLHLNNK